MDSIFFEITVIICVAALLVIIFRILKQPTIIAYIITGIIIGPFGQLQLQNYEVLKSMGDIGIALLLFILGLEFRFSQLQSIGKKAFSIGVLQFVMTMGLGYGISLLFGFSNLSALYIGGALTFSSTVLVVALLSDKDDLLSPHGKMTVGILLMQDFFAIIVLMLLSGFTFFADSKTTVFDIMFGLFRGGILLFFVWVVSKIVLTRVSSLLKNYPDALFLCSLAWVFGLSKLGSSSLFGMPLAVGGFLAGISLANVVENQQIMVRARALRDFFMIMFFVTIGMQTGSVSMETLLFVVLLTIFVLIIKPLLVLLIMVGMGHQKNIAFRTGFSLGQISEFSLLIIFLGAKLGHVPGMVVSIVTFVGITSFLVSTYVIMYNKHLYEFLEKKLLRR